MSELDAALEQLRSHEGVEQVILLGSDGLVIQELGDTADADAIAARVPGLASAATSLGAAASRGDLTTAVLEYGGGIAVVVSLSPDLLLATLLRPGVGFAPLLRELRSERNRFVELL